MTLKSTVDGMRRDNVYSPDIGWLERNFSYVPVFVYGTQMKNYSGHSSMSGFPRIGIGATVRPRFTMFEANNEPIVFDSPNSVYASIIHGEVYVVPPHILFHLDGLFCRGVHFYRRQEAIRYRAPEDLMKPTAPTFESDMWMFIGLEAAWRKSIDNQNCRRMGRLTVNDRDKYYRFTLGDDKNNEPAHTHMM